MIDNSVYVSGVGVISSLGRNYKEHTKGLYEMKTCIKQAHFENQTHQLDSYVGQVTQDIEVPKQFESYYKNFKLAFKAFAEALEDSQVDLSHYKKIGICLGTSLGGKVIGQKVFEKTLQGDYDFTYDDFEKRSIHHIVDEILDFYDIEAEYYVISTACSASNNAAILGAQLLKNNDCDLVFAGGCDELTDVSLAGFSSLGAINSEEACQPYTTGDGISLGEGAGFIVLEREETMSKRKKYAKILSGAISSDGYHITAPDKSGKGAETIIDQVLESSGIDISQIDYVNGHGTGTMANDSMERHLFERKFPTDTTISSTKGHIGHTLGAAGMIELINCIATIENQMIPGTVNDSLEVDQDTCFIKNKTKQKRVTYALNLSFAFGGNNSCVLVASPNVSEEGMVAKKLPSILFTGSSSSLTDEFNQLLTPSDHPDYKKISSEYSQLSGFKYHNMTIPAKINPQQYRRMDNLSKMVVKTVLRAIQHSGMALSDVEGSRTGIVFTTPSGPVETIEDIEKQIYQSGYHSASAVKFPFTVMNAAAGMLSILFKIKGPVSVISTVGTCFVDGVEYAKEMLTFDEVDRVILVSANQLTPLSLAMWETLEFDTECFSPADFCSAFILEKAEGTSQTKTQMIGSHQTKYSNRHKNVDTIQAIFDKNLATFLQKHHLNLSDMTSVIVNDNKKSDRAEYQVLSEFIKQHPTFNTTSFTFTSDGAGEELVYLLSQNQVTGYHLVVTTATFGGFSFLIVKN